MPEATRTSDQAASALRDFHPQLRTEVAPPSSEDYNCPICLDLLLEPVVGACGHEFCKDCYTSWLSRSGGYPNCPLCRKSLAYTVPGVSRRLAELIEAIFPEKTKLRRQMKDQERAAETVHALPPEYDPTESGRLPYSSPAYSPYRYPSTSPPHPFASPSDSYTASPRNAALSPAHSPGAAATRPGSAGRASPAAQTEPTGRQAAGSGFAALPHTFPAADERLPAYRDFSRLLQSTDQLAQQLQGASERLSYLSDYAGRSFGRYAGSATFPGAFWAAQRAQLQSPHAVEPYAAYIASRGGAPAAPWAAYGHYPAPSFTAYPPAPSYGPYTAAGPAGSSFAQSMPPPGTLPFTMGSEPREPARGSRRAQVAATAMNPARYRIGRGQRRS